jgi:polyisoprenoid-binding protein YceI
MDMKVMDCDVNLTLNGSGVQDIHEIKFSGKAKELKSESNLMDKKAYAALRSDKFPEIKFIKTSLTGLLSENNKFSGKLAGDLSVAGETRRVNFPFTGTMGSNRTIDINGEIELKMSDFKIDPPTAMLGTLKTGDAISVSFTLRLVPE